MSEEKSVTLKKKKKEEEEMTGQNAADTEIKNPSAENQGCQGVCPLNLVYFIFKTNLKQSWVPVLWKKTKAHKEVWKNFFYKKV